MDRYCWNDFRRNYLYFMSFILKIMNLEKTSAYARTKKILVQKAKTEYYRGFNWLDVDIQELKNFIEEVKKTKSITKLDKITFNLFHY